MSRQGLQQESSIESLAITLSIEERRECQAAVERPLLQLGIGFIREVTAVQLKDGFLSHTADTKDCFLG